MTIDRMSIDGLGWLFTVLIDAPKNADIARCMSWTPLIRAVDEPRRTVRSVERVLMSGHRIAEGYPIRCRAYFGTGPVFYRVPNSLLKNGNAEILPRWPGKNSINSDAVIYEYVLFGDTKQSLDIWINLNKVKMMSQIGIETGRIVRMSVAGRRSRSITMVGAEIMGTHILERGVVPLDGFFAGAPVNKTRETFAGS